MANINDVPANSNESNVREHGMKSLNKITRVLSDSFGAFIPTQVYGEIKKDIESGPYDQVYTRIDVFTKLYISMTGIKKRLNTKSRNLITDKDQIAEASVKLWDVIKTAYYESNLRPHLKDITDAMEMFLSTEEK